MAWPTTAVGRSGASRATAPIDATQNRANGTACNGTNAAPTATR